MRYPVILIFVYLFYLSTGIAQWTNRYPKVEGYGHHVYLEGFELPVLNAGPVDPAPSPLNDQVVFSAKGWLWIMGLNELTAKRITSSPHLDSKPNWSPDGKQIVFVRDNGQDTKIVLMNIASGEESTLIDTDALDLDPIFTLDGKFIYYASAENGSIDIWRLDLSSLQKQLITNEDNLERLPVPNSKGNSIIYLRKRGFSYDSIELLDLNECNSTPLAEDNFASQVSFTLSPDDQTLAFTWPYENRYEIRLLDLSVPSNTLLLTKSNGLPLSPKFSSDGQWIYYAENRKNERSTINRIAVTGGLPQELKVKTWDWGITTGKLKITSTVDGKMEPVRMSILGPGGHPIIPEEGAVHFDGQNGIVFFYSPGEIEVEAPLGELTISAVQGFATQKGIQKAVINESSTTEVEISLSRVWDANAQGWYSGDNHFHLNYGGTYQLDPGDIITDVKGEGLDIAFPLLANLHNRFLEQNLWGWKNEGPPIINFGQEIRSHFLGHLGLIGTQELYWPWVWGPYYDVYGRDDRLNADPLRFARNQGALGGYVHPVSIQDPFTEEGAYRVPVALVADCVLGESDLIELGCLWTDEIGTGAVWHKILNLGVPIALSAGSDVMNDYYRTMAIGADRVFVKPDGPLTTESYLKALKNGKSFVSNGPMLVFNVDDKEVGGIIQTERKKVKWTLAVHSPVPFEKVEIFVNGEVVWTQVGNDKPGSANYRGSVEVPAGGWITARASGGKTEWPLMDSYPFAETSPVWFNEIGSVDSLVAIDAAKDLLKVLTVSENRLKQGYGQNPIPNLLNHFDKAKQKLLKIISAGED